MGVCTAPLTVTRPLSAFRADNPFRPQPGSPGVFFDRKSGQYRVQQSVPCSKCHSCIAARASQWVVRCYCESQLHERSAFVTLTYDDDHLPRSGKLVPDDLANFWKRLRKESSRKLRYFACGEYGEKTHRPHYHAIIFGEDFLGGAEKFNDEHWISPELTDIWGKGFTTTTPVSMASICYTVGYVAKKIGQPDVFQRMSRNPGIGADWLATYEDDIRCTGAVTIEGREYPVPKYFLDRDDFTDLVAYRKTLSKPLKAAARQSRAINAEAKANRSRGRI